ncbi:hypothetical protein [Paenibacillus apiarius]|uniref:Translation initiation factor 2 n=1 Tax=Paenibacillus apiarius TaxID=46240 RepID=A0ABT4DWP0_9BACL|nr:hypothetical protein [Paenibacillus apiarius]MCY9516921.1 translation initiation factor 2 [Paenibacillus apiarius]MCY9521767.1 translation initiation factor 2 [Paenibacillus apiarius]MCY9551552.1 translation initiation factor 2 [Paenibacillus apiarius]MCY9558707.1 translation initiation factor 2 [Paenibacillus apiarius]MCY9683979.1 translation initiation factor 2 [Paenibacillus apiarius]
MSRYMKRLIGMIVLLALGVFIGMEVATVGMDRVYGPLGAGREALNPAVSWRADEIGDEGAARRSGSQPQRSGMEPWSGAHANQRDRIEAKRDTAAYEGGGMPDSPWLPPVEDAPVNKLADKTAGLLQHLSQAGIRAVVGLFSGLF